MKDLYSDGLIRTFIEVPIFSKRWAEIGLGEDELLSLQIMLLKDPKLVKALKEEVKNNRGKNNE
ncbi:MAG: hypothetical protein K6G12_05320 [Lachnospiraceae bacterium]|nr:hypothetical protein [Lachnospiraceae bacterium]